MALPAVAKSYSCVGNNEYVEDASGACIGAEWTDLSGNTLVMLWAYSPQFNNSGNYIEMSYKLLIKPVGFANFFLAEELLDKIDSSLYVQGDPLNINFGKVYASPIDSLGEPIVGIETRIQFFIDNFILNIHDIPVSFRIIVNPFIQTSQDVIIS